MLGLERVLSEKPSTTAAGTELRRHQVDALAGMLTELIAVNQRAADENGNGNGHAKADAELEPEDEDDELEEELDVDDPDDEEDIEEAGGFVGEDPGASRRFRFRHPTASGKTIAAGGFVESAAQARDPDPDAPPPARLPVPARPDDRGLRRPLRRRDHPRQRASPHRPDHDPDVRAGSHATTTRSRARRTSS